MNKRRNALIKCTTKPDIAPPPKQPNPIPSAPSPKKARPQKYPITKPKSSLPFSLRTKSALPKSSTQTHLIPPNHHHPLSPSPHLPRLPRTPRKSRKSPLFCRPPLASSSLTEILEPQSSESDLSSFDHRSTHSQMLSRPSVESPLTVFLKAAINEQAVVIGQRMREMEGRLQEFIVKEIKGIKEEIGKVWEGSAVVERKEKKRERKGEKKDAEERKSDGREERGRKETEKKKKEKEEKEKEKEKRKRRRVKKESNL